jgi:hypothetical protein
MRFPITPDDLEREILICSDMSNKLGDLRLRQLIQILSKVNPEMIVEAIIRIFENHSRPEQYLQDQEFAGKILEIINPYSQKELKEVLLRGLPNWDQSVEQFPFWLRANYGVDNLKKTFAELELEGVKKDKLMTIKWWLELI